MDEVNYENGLGRNYFIHHFSVIFKARFSHDHGPSSNWRDEDSRIDCLIETVSFNVTIREGLDKIYSVLVLS